MEHRQRQRRHTSSSFNEKRPMDRSLHPTPLVLSKNQKELRNVKNDAAENKRQSSTVSLVPIARPGIGSKGQRISLLTNHFKVEMSSSDIYFFHYNVAMFYEDGCTVEQYGINRRILDKMHETYKSDFAGKVFAYDGEKSLFTIGSLPHKKIEFDVVLDDQVTNRREDPDDNGSPSEISRKRSKGYRSRSFKVEISYATKIPIQSIAMALRGQESEHFHDAIRVLDLILRQHAAKRGCLLVRQSSFHNEPKNFTFLGGGVMGCRGFHSSFRATQSGLSLNIGVSTTMIVQPGPVIDFLLNNQNVRDSRQIDWNKAKRMLKSLRIKVLPSGAEYKITGLSERICRKQMFWLPEKTGLDGNAGAPPQEISVYDYFVSRRNIKLRDSADLPCINVGKPKRPNFIPVELCELVSLQRYTKALSTLQRASLVEKSRQSPKDCMMILSEALKKNNYNADPVIRSSGISISTDFTKVEGRVLTAPKLKMGNGSDVLAQNGRWNFNNKKLVQPTNIQRWAVVDFSNYRDVYGLCKDLMKCAQMKGIVMAEPFKVVFKERPENRRSPAHVRVEKMWQVIDATLPKGDDGKGKEPQLLLCILPEKRNSDLYGPWKRKNLVDKGIVTQCIAPTTVNDQYLTSVLLKINAKLGGMNTLLSIEHSPSMPIVSELPTMIIGMDVSHGSPGQSNVPSIAAVVASRQWPLISKYRALVRTQSPKSEMIASLFMPMLSTSTGTNVDHGIIRELLVDFYVSSGRKPEQIIIFRDGVSESQFTQVLNVELNQIIEACKFLEEKWNPKFIFIVAQKNHHTRFFRPDSPENVPPGTIIDNKICHPRNNDFYLSAHAGMIGTTRPTHYHVLHDEIGYSADEMQELVHSLSYVYQRSTTAVSVVAPICYAHLAAAQVSQFIKFDEMSETSSSHGGMTSVSDITFPELPNLHKNVRRSMYFC